LDSGATTDRAAVIGALRLVQETGRTHAELLTQLAGVYRVFRGEQDRQRFTHRPTLARLADLRHDVLHGFMALTIAEADALVPHPSQLLLGAIPGPIITLPALVERLLSPPREAALGAEVEALEWVDDVPDDSKREQLLPWLAPERVDGRLLSEVLADARPALDDDELRRLAAIGLEAFAAEHLAALGGADDLDDEDDALEITHASVPDVFVVGVPTGLPLLVPGASWLAGDDLRLSAAQVVDEADHAA
jgi:hypothetical protein